MKSKRTRPTPECNLVSQLANGLSEDMIDYDVIYDRNYIMDYYVSWEASKSPQFSLH